MRTVAIIISNVKYLDRIHDCLKQYQINDKFSDKMKLIREEVHEFIKDMPLTRIYFGNEFCENLIPTLNEMKLAIKEAESCGLDFTLLTPYVTQYGIDKLKNLFHYLDTEYSNAEIVFNDWGIYYFIKNNYKSLICIPGRLIDKMIKEPRFGKNHYKDLFNNEGLEYIMSPSFFSEPYQMMLQKNNIKRIELDFVPQGLLVDKTIDAISLSVYIPFYYITSGRQCMLRIINRKEDEKFLLDNKCNRICRNYNIIMYKQLEAFNEDEEKLGYIELYRKGNTIFSYNLDIGNLLKIEVIDRFIFQPDLSY